MIKRKIISMYITILSLIVFLGGCSNKLMDEAKQSDVMASAGLLEIEAADYGYGEIAYKYLEYIQESLPGRIAFTEREKETAAFIISALLDMGYTSDSITVQSFPSNGAASSYLLYAVEIGYNNGETLKRSQNIIVTKNGESEKTIIVAAHYDSVSTHGVYDNGSGISVLLESAMRMKDEETPYTIKYVFFGSEELILLGSKYYVEHLSQKEKDNILVMINIDSIIAGDTKYVSGGVLQSDGTVSDDWAVVQVYEFAQNLGLDIHLQSENTNVFLAPDYRTIDSASFSKIGIPFVHFDDINWDSGGPVVSESVDDLIMHTENDNLEYLNSTFPGRAKSSLKDYSTLLDYTLKYLSP